MRSVAILSALCGLASAHFELSYPKSIGFEDKTEDKAPCGGFKPDLSGDDLPEFHVEGDAIATTLTHSQGKWLYRITTDEKAESNWTQVYPIVLQSGLGKYCQPKVTIPDEYVGKKGIISVVSAATDGLLYQCSVVKFVKGSADQPDSCKNASSVKASFDSDGTLSKLVGAGATGTPKPDDGDNKNKDDDDNKNAAVSLQSLSISGAMLLSLGLMGAAFVV